MKQQKSRNNPTSIHWVGIDVAKATFDAGLVRRDQRYPDTPLREIPAASFKHSPEGIKTFLTWLDTQGIDGEEVRVIMEASGGPSVKLALYILEQRPALTPAIVNPYQTAAFIKSMNVRNKTDRLEARALGFYGIERNPMAYEPPTPEHAELRELSRYRDRLVKEQTALKNQTKETCHSTTVRKTQTKRMKLLVADIKHIEQSMKKLVTQHDDLKRDIELLSSIFGVAFINAAMIIAELGDLRRFEHARQLTAFAGMSPKHRQSGTSIHGRTRLCKQGNPRVRRGLYLSAMVAIRGNNKMRQTYQKLLKEGKPKMVALGAIMRKLLVLMRAILIGGKPYQPMGITR
jgi:transposase